MASPHDTQAPPPGGDRYGEPRPQCHQPGSGETLGDLAAQWGKPSCPWQREGQDIWGEQGFTGYWKQSVNAH